MDIPAISASASIPSADSGQSAMDRKIEALIRSIQGLTSDAAVANVIGKKLKELQSLLIQVILANMTGASTKGIQAQIHAVEDSLHKDISFFKSAGAFVKSIENDPSQWSASTLAELQQIQEQLETGNLSHFP